MSSGFRRGGNGGLPSAVSREARLAPMDPLAAFHPAVRAWFARRFPRAHGGPGLGWPAIARGGDVLIAAPTGSGKTLAAFLCAIDRLLRSAGADGAGRRPERPPSSTCRRSAP